MPSMNISEFVANYAGGARPNRFRVTLSYPAFALFGGQNNAQFLVRAASIPASHLGTVKVAYMGREYPVPGDRTFDPWPVTIYNEESFDHRNAMERWSNGINAHRGNFRVAAPVTVFTQNAMVDQLSVTGAVIKRYIFLDLWPSEVGAIELAWDQNDQVETFQTTFQYSRWEAVTTS